MSKLNDLKNALKVLEDSEMEDSVLEAVRQEIVCAENDEKEDEKVISFRLFKLHKVDGQDPWEVTAWHMLSEPGQNSWREAYKKYSEYFSQGVEITPPKSGTFSAHLEDKEQFRFFSDLSVLINRHDPYGSISTGSLSDEQFSEFVNFINYLDAKRKGKIDA